MDMGAFASLLLAKVHHKLFPDCTLQDCTLLESASALYTYSAETISVVKQLMVKVSYQIQHAKLPLEAVKGADSNFFGRNW